ncbi:MAG TPA: hypothetical protein VMU47_02865 [Caldimonas sp.]|nr:hypothetical protein [Caldimonas sp.]
MTHSIDWRSLTRGIFAALAIGGIASPASAQETPAQAMISSPLTASLGAFVFNTDLNARLNGQSSSNPDVDFDNDFGRGRDATRVRADVLWRITPKHHLRLLYFDYNNNTTRVLSQDVQWGDYTFLSGSAATSEFKFNTTELAYEYAFLHETNYEVAGSLGVHYMSIKLGISGTANIRDANGNVTQVSSASKEGDLPAPLPVLGVRAGWAVTPNWYLEGSGQLFRVSIDGYHGNVGDVRANATYMFSRHFGLGLGYDYFRTSVDVDRTNFNGHLRIGYHGLMAYLTGAF